MSCFWFGHSPSGVTAKLLEQMKNPGFECRRCGSIVMWADMPKRIRDKRDEVLKAVARG